MFAEMKNKALEYDEIKICAEFEKKKHAIQEKGNLCQVKPWCECGLNL